MRVVKRAISLPKELDAQLKELSEATDRSYSGLVCEALGMYLKEKERREIERAYATYYAGARSGKDAELAAELTRLSERSWPR